MLQDFRLALRSLRATPVVTAVAVLSLALGIGANTAIFSLVDGLLLRSLPVLEPEQLTILLRGPNGGAWTYPIWNQLRERPELFNGVFATGPDRFNLARAGETEFVEGIWASGGMFTTLGVPAIAGRTFTDADDRVHPDAAVVVLSYDFWQRRFSGAADVVGRTLTLDRVPFTIVGVTAPGFFGPEIGRTFDVAIPLGAEPLIRGRDSLLDRSAWWLSIMARLKPGQTIEMATAALRGVQPQIRDATMPDNWPADEIGNYLKDPFSIEPGAGGPSIVRQRYQQPLLAIMAVVAIVLLIACANIANLLLARAAARRHELSVRRALGASRGRLVRQLLTESLVLAGLGALFGVVFALWGSELLLALLSSTGDRVFIDIGLDWRVLAFTFAVTVTTALLFGIAPALRAGGAAPMDALSSHGRGIAGLSRTGLANGLVVGQVALSVVLVVAAGLFVRTFVSLATLDPGFERDRALVVNIDTLPARIEPANRMNIFTEVLREAGGVQGVTNAALSVVTPVSRQRWNVGVEVPGVPIPAGPENAVNLNWVTPGFFATYVTPLIAGRDFDDHDVKGGQPVVVINQAFARKYFPRDNPIGKTLVMHTGGGPSAPKVIVGLVADAAYRSLRTPASPGMYGPLAQIDAGPFLSTMSLTVRAAAGSPLLLTKSVGAAAMGVNRDLALTFRPLSDYLDASLVQERVVAVMAAFFGALAILLAGLGLYGVTSYAVSRRRTELGIRMALGSAPDGVVRLVLGRVFWLVGAGVVIGSAVSLWASRFVSTLLYGLEPNDVATLAMAAGVLALVGGLAGWIPARRASRIDPADVLREI